MKFFNTLLVVIIVSSSMIASSYSNITPIGEIELDFAQKINGSHSRVIGGYEAKKGQFPYQVRVIVFRGFNDVRMHNCGGSLVALDWVLTAGHCYVENTDPLDPITYEIETGSIVSGEPYQRDRVPYVNAYLHPMYNSTTLEYDVALLKTEKFELDAYVDVIKMSFAPPSKYFIGKILTVSGFGYISNDGPVSPVLKWTKLTMIPWDECYSNYTGGIPESCFCAVDEKPPISSICDGDSGGPIVYYVNGVPKQIGLVSFGKEICEEAPQGFADLSNKKIKEWIIKIMLRK